MSKRAVVIRKGNADDEVRIAVKQLLNGTGSLLVDNRNCSTMTSEAVKEVVATAKRIGAPVIVEQGAVGHILKALGLRGYWMFIQREAKRFSFWFIDGKGDPQNPPEERMITV